MSAPRLLIRKVMMNVQGRIRPCIQIQADVPPVLAAQVSGHFINEYLFKRTSYSQGPLDPASFGRDHHPRCFP